MFKLLVNMTMDKIVSWQEYDNFEIDKINISKWQCLHSKLDFIWPEDVFSLDAVTPILLASLFVYKTRWFANLNRPQ